MSLKNVCFIHTFTVYSSIFVSEMYTNKIECDKKGLCSTATSGLASSIDNSLFQFEKMFKFSF